MNLNYYAVVICLCSTFVSSAKVMVVPMNMGSHIGTSGQIASALVAGGHEAVMYIPSNNKAPKDLNPNVRVVSYKASSPTPVVNTDELSQVEIDQLSSDSMQEWMRCQFRLLELLTSEWSDLCGSLMLMYPAIKEEKFDIAIMDAAVGCMLAIPYKLDIPWVSMSAPFAEWRYRMPHLSSQFPTLLVTHSDNMTFWQRLQTFSMDMLAYVMQPNNMDFIKTHVPERDLKGERDLLVESAMWWYLYDLSVGYPKASMPNTLDVGDVMARPARQLPKEYLDILESSPNGVVLVSLGSGMDFVPQEWLDKFCDAFNSVKYTVIWKMKITPSCVRSSNVHVKQWIPQNDLLAHPKLVLFISHCGINSVIESISHGKPIVAVPIAIDQPYNAAVVEHKGFGKRLDLKSFSSNDLSQTMEEVIESKTYSKATLQASKILGSKAESPSTRMSFWVNHVVQHGHKHLRTKAHDLYIWQFLMFDIYLFLTVICIVSIALLITICIVCYRLCCRYCLRRTKAKTE